MSWPEPHEFDDGPPWDRQPTEPARQYGAFRIYRDQPTHQRDIAAVAALVKLSERRAREWAVAWDWRGRAQAWDDACHRLEDVERLEAIRAMHKIHRSAGRAALAKAAQALAMIDPATLPVNAVARLLALGAKLERDTLIVSVEELQGVEVFEDEAPDPWERIARELDPDPVEI